MWSCSLKALLCVENPATLPSSPVYAENIQFQRIVLDQVPCVAFQFALHALNNVRRSVDSERRLSMQDCPEKKVEANEMINMSMGYKNIRYFLKIAGAES